MGNKKEIWKDVVGFKGLYQVSSLGIIRSLDRLVCRRDTAPFVKKGRVLKLHLAKNGYQPIQLAYQKHRDWPADNWRRQKDSTYVHRVVAQAFIPNPKELPCINHKNGDKTDNRVDNLEWCDVLDNAFHSLVTGLALSKSGQNSPTAKITNEDALKIIELLKKGEHNQTEISLMFGVSQTAISAISRGKSWNSVTGLSKTGFTKSYKRYGEFKVAMQKDVNLKKK